MTQAADACVLSLDQGTTSSRAIVFDNRGEIVAKGQRAFEQIYPQPGWVEHDPREILSSQLTAAAESLSSLGDDAKIACVGVTNQRETVILWDKRTGEPVSNAIVWQCRRTAEMCEKMVSDGMKEYVAQKTGLIIDAYFSATKIKWILDNTDGVRQRADRGDILFGTVDTWIIWNLTGGKSHVTDYSNASRTMLFDIDNLKWDEELCRYFDIPPCMLPTPFSGCEVVGYVAAGIRGLERIAGVPVSGIAGDQAAALFGQGCHSEGMVKNTYGTGCFTLMNIGSKKGVRSSHGLVTSAAWCIGGETVYAIEGSAFNAGAAIQWLRDEMRLISSAPECDSLAESVADTGGAHFIPAFTGLGAPYWDMYARGMISGITRGTNRAHIARAVLESIAYQVCDLVETMEIDTGWRVTELRADGGASVSEFLMQFQSDMLNTAVNRPRMVETTALGAALLAGIAVGVWDVRTIGEVRATDKVYLPKMETTERDKLYGAWKREIARARMI